VIVEMDIIIKNCRFYIDQIIYQHVKDEIYSAYKILLITIGKDNEIQSLTVKHIIFDECENEITWGCGNIMPVSTFDYGLKYLLTEKPENAKFI
jgi:hypothetical protein